MMRETPQISKAEYEVMKVIWENEPISTPRIVDKISMDIDWKPNTIQTMLARLVKKKALKTRKEGRAHVYSSLIKEDEFIEQKSKSFLNQYFGGMLNSMVLNFIENDNLTVEDISELKELLDEKEKKGSKNR